MQLTRLEMYGFKSFSMRTSFSFSPGITTFVGPNGCGKSNVVDAIRWVLGEQNPRTIRANKMEDLIFAGDASQQKNYAEVSIVLDNGSQQIPLAYREVTITRRLYRSGESEYFINRTPCRLKDISELLAATSLGKGSYAIIGQGQVEEVINSKPEDRRQMFEEAAGIALFKMRKREALKKLADTRSNLTRLDDLIGELSSQQQDIADSAGKAQSYLELKEQADKVELTLWAIRYRDLWDRIQQAQQKHTQLTEAQQQNSGRRRQLEQTAAQLTGTIQECQSVLAALSNKLATLANEKKELDYQVELWGQRQQDYDNMAVNAQQVVTALAGQIGDVESKLVQLRQRAALAQEKLHSFGQAMEKRLGLNKSIGRMLGAVEKYQGETAGRLLQMMLEQSQVDSRYKQAEQKIAELAEQGKEREATLAKLAEQHKELEGECQALRRQHDALATEVDKLQAELLRATAAVNHQRSTREEIAAKRSLYQAKLAAARQQLAMLQEMEEEHQGFAPGTRAILQGQQRGELDGVVGAVADLIQVKDEAHTLAIETALGAALQYVVCRDEEHCRQAIEFLKRTGRGRATLVPLTVPTRDISVPSLPPGCQQATEVVEYAGQLDAVVARLLGNVLVARDLALATELARQTKYRYKIVTLEGDFISGGFFTGGTAKKNNQGLLQRKNSMRRWEQTIAELSACCRQAEEGLAAADSALAQLEKEAERIREDKARLEEKRAAKRFALQQAEEKWAHTGQQLRAARTEQHKLAVLLEDARRQRDRMDRLVAGSRSNLEQLQKQKGFIKKTEEELSNYHNLGTACFNRLQVSVASLRNQAQGAQQNIKLLEDQLADLAARRDKASSEAESYREQSKVLVAKLAEARKRLGALRSEMDTVGQSLSSKTDSLKLLQREMEVVNEGLVHNREEQVRLEKGLHETEVKLARWDTERQAMAKELGDRFGLTSQQGLQYFDATQSVSQLNAQLRVCQGRMAELGEVNLAAIQQYKALTQRLEFLTQEKRDLEAAEGDILDLVAQLDAKIRDMFMETFSAVGHHFTRIFKTLFGGGNAYLSLSDQQDLLETGIDIFAQPPGKKIQSLSLLSGGEKAMTAIALLFALQSVRPSPFCILDEIEAALDDVNIVRFAHYVRELSAHMQFILITHRRETMEHSDTLYGITLGQGGVSKPISVKLNSQAEGERHGIV